METRIQEESEESSFGTKGVPSLNGVDSSFMNSVAGSYFVKPSGSNILHDSANSSK